jgi:error-prone DNA polymerase
VESVLKRTLGIPIFQEQVMQLAIVAAGFTPGEADQLRRSMAAWKRRGGLNHFQQRIVDGMRLRGYGEAFAEQIFQQIEGFGHYGFPESHAASFALLVYASAWIKCHYPAVFVTALLNAQPMGFYSASQLIRDAKAHAVNVLPVDIGNSDWLTRLDDDTTIRLGLHQVKGLGEAAGQRIVEARSQAPFDDLADLKRRAVLDLAELRALSDADALYSLTGHRYQTRWQIAGLGVEPPGLPLLQKESAVVLPSPTLDHDIRADYASVGFSLKGHPLTSLRPLLRQKRLLNADELAGCQDRAPVRTAGLVTCRQRPGTAAGVTFITLEDEAGSINVIVPKALSQKQRRECLGATLLVVFGVWQKQGRVMHLLAKRLVDGERYLHDFPARSRDFH